jgi:hypothetical protein
MNSSQSSVNSSRLRALVFAIMLTMSAFVVPSLASHASAAGFAFSNYEISLSRNSSTPVVTCPNSNTPPNCWNVNAEPNIATAPDGTIYVSSENAAFNHPSECPNQESTPYICGGTGAWKSTDSGSHFTNLLSPNVAFVSSNPVTFWGGDTDVVTGTVPNSNGYYNVYVVSLEAGGAGLIGAGLSVSQDGGQTWGPIGTVVTFTNPIADPVVTDRPWVSAIGANTVCISSHDGAANPDVYCSTDAGTSFGPPTPVFDASHAFLVSETSIPGALHIDPSNGNYIYVPFAGVSNVNEAEQDSSCGTSPLPSDRIPHNVGGCLDRRRDHFLGPHSLQ